MLPRASLAGCALILAVTLPNPASAQSLGDVLNELFVFGGEDQPLFLAGSPGLHGQHFIPSESETNNVLLQFFNNSLATNISSFPLSSTVGSQTFEFIGGVPTPTTTSFGPIFAERAQTLGTGRLNAGFNVSRLRFNQIRGVDLNDIQLTFIHDNVGDTTVLGDVQVENDLLNLALDLEMEAEVYAFYATFGLAEWADVSLAVPLVDLRIAGTSRAVVTPSTTDSALHFFTGTPENPVLEATNSESGSAFGIGDIAGRLKLRVARGENWATALLGEVRAPTGDEEDFLGTGDFNGKGLFIGSATIGDFAPHTNLGFEYRGSPLAQNEAEVVVGFDQRLADWATLAVDFLGTFKLGEEKLTFPEDIRITEPFERTVRRTNIRDIRDDILEGSIGVKLRTQGGAIIIANVLVPLNDGGLRSSPIPTLGVEYSP